LQQKIEIIDLFSFLKLRGPVDLKTPNVTFGILEDFELAGDHLRKVYLGHRVGHGNRSAIDKFALKKRQYLGTTSMDAELSLIMANMAQVKPGDLVYDPFVGTGSMMVVCSHFGGFSLGSDIDGRQMRGTGKGHARKGTPKDAGLSIWSNVHQYALEDRTIGCFVCDLSHHPLRESELFDAIVTDPPYGVRAGAKKIGIDPKKLDWIEKEEPSEARHDYGKYPQTVPYDLDAVISDLTDFASRHLRVGGRLVYWLPTVKAQYVPEDIPTHPALRLLFNCEQPFGVWSRRLITLEKTCHWAPDMKVQGNGLLGYKLEESSNAPVGSSASVHEKEPGHKAFREKYFKSIQSIE
jgi:tRNA (guanine10-N2)-methyltransferase